ncbi:fibropellin-3-like [Mytilus edulis]|uniref:fibropellin-3-like n=1 Tax=Mytilus edulis TaxID=6550 RepID=UPI0039EFB72C
MFPTIVWTIISLLIKKGTFIVNDKQSFVDALSLCKSFPCLHGTCLPAANGYICYCEPGFTGKNCEIDEDDCEREPCSYGTCVDEINGYTCVCNVLFHGKNCSQMNLWAVISFCAGTFILLSFGCCCLVCCPCCRRHLDDEKKNQVGQERRQTEAWTC